MSASARPQFRRRPGRDLVLLFAFTILLPGLVLGVMGITSLVRERTLADQQIRQRLDGIAERAAARVEAELAAWRDALEVAARTTSTIDASALPAWMHQAGGDPGGLALVVMRRDDPRVWPDRALAYRPWLIAAAAPRTVAPALASAEAAELKDDDRARSLARYRALIGTVPEADRPELLLRIAMTLRRLDRWADSLAALRDMAVLTSGRVGIVPADLIARAEICAHYAAKGPASALASAAQDLERDLIEGRWAIDQPRYLDYLGRAQAWIAESPLAHTPAERVRLAADDTKKRALADVVSRLVDGDGRARAAAAPAGTVSLISSAGSPAYATMWMTDEAGAGAHATILAVSVSWLEDHRWPAVLAPFAEPGFSVSLVTPAGETVYASPGPPAQAGSSATIHVGRRALAAAGSTWQVEVRPQNVDALYADLARGRDVSIAMLAVTLALLGFGTYLTARVVRREMEIARMKSDFVSAVSHEFRSPLTGIRQLGEMLARGRVPNEARRQEYYDRITGEADRLSRVVESLLDVSRMEEGRKTYAFEPIDTGTWLAAVVDEFRPTASAAGHRIAADISEALPPVVADREALATAVHNLLDNAVKYSPDADTIWVDAATADGHVTIRVRDRGIGIADADRAHLFERFHRGSTEEARRTKGVGLGLSLTRHIVTAHGGRIEFESEPEEGSTFMIAIPVANQVPVGDFWRASGAPRRSGVGRWGPTSDGERGSGGTKSPG